MAPHPFERTANVEEEGPPPLEVRYFYASTYAIDDPLSPVPPALSGSSKAVIHPPRPFSEDDNRRLDRTWYSLHKRIQQYEIEKEKQRKRQAIEEANRSKALRELEQQRPSRRGSNSSTSRARARSLLYERSRDRSLAPKASTSTLRREYTRERSNSIESEIEVVDHPADTEFKSSYEEHTDGLTGNPFIRAPSRKTIQLVRPTSSQGTKDQQQQPQQSDAKLSSSVASKEDLDESKVVPKEDASPTDSIPVGVSRLHQVLLPALQMGPIYWRPVNDEANVLRASWFYKDTMLPVESDVANMLESGYLQMRPWSRTWKDEIRSAMEAGALGEEKVTHPLWPEEVNNPQVSRPASAMGSVRGVTVVDPQDNTPEKRREEAVKRANVVIKSSSKLEDDRQDRRAFGQNQYGSDGRPRQYPEARVVFDTDGKTAHILRPNLQPSDYYGRRPIANYIEKGKPIGITVVRGFDQSAWDKANPDAKSSVSEKANTGATAAPAVKPASVRFKSNPALSLSERGLPTDLILVIHGIGQKLSERVESYNFTHAINSFRRDVNVELGSPNVQQHLRPDMGSIMTLPVNWRAALKFDEQESGNGDSDDGATDAGNFNLPDITLDTLPSVRSLVSDVLLDIPYYLSHHQPKMIAAVIKEANRVYQAWCENNPGFEKHGRVHIIGHSLGSVMALDILSKQPTYVNDPRSKSKEKVGNASLDHFAFDTHNLYLCGSPASLFLLLRRGRLIPRRGRKTTDDSSDDADEVVGEVGSFGCLAIDNIYNIIHPQDPICYQCNATVDSVYASTLRQALLPTTATSWFSFSNPFRPSSSSKSAYRVPVRPNLTSRLPSNVELEIHNFSREEIAEKRAFLLNDNGQVDFYMRGGGPLEFQYLTMLSAHSSYWQSKDVARFIVIEIGRRQGRDGTLEALRATKKKQGRKMSES